jgi:hypothetical protein
MYPVRSFTEQAKETQQEAAGSDIEDMLYHINREGKAIQHRRTCEFFIYRPSPLSLE